MSTSDLDEQVAQRIVSFVERLEYQNERLAEIQEEKKEIKAEAKGEGLDVKMIDKLVALRKKSDVEREEEETVLELYKRAIGMA